MTYSYAGAPGAGPQQVAVRDQEHNAALIAVAWTLTVFTGFYLLPWAVAVSRGKTDHGRIAVVNVLLGWTVIGWIVALVMACGAHPVLYVAAQPSVAGWPEWSGPEPSAGPPAGWYPAPEGYGQRFWDGAGWTEHTLP